MVETGIIPTGYERTLPPEAQLLVRARRRHLVRRSEGRVLDLGGAEAHRGLWAGTADVVVLDGVDDARLGELDGGFDTIVSVFQLASAADLDATLRRLHDLLADDGRLRFVEPARLVGVGGRLQRAVAPGIGAFTGWRADRDIPLALRRAGLSVTDVARHRVTTLQPWLRQVVEGTAHRALRPGAGAGG
ncbi:MAG: hypothetical protein ACLGIC_14140 [Acidimicrobiia bacterium]